jgi:hypothetical protein
MDQTHFGHGSSRNSRHAGRTRSRSTSRWHAWPTTALGDSRQGECGWQVYLSQGGKNSEKLVLARVVDSENELEYRLTVGAVALNCFLRINALVVPPRDIFELIASLVQFNLNRWNGYH